MIELIIFSDIRVYADGLSRLLTEQESIGLVSIENKLENVIAMLDATPQYIMLIDMTMRNSCALTRHLTQMYPQSRIITIASSDDEQKLIECTEIDISGYLTRDATIEELTTVIFSASNGEFSCPPRIVNMLFNKLRHSSRDARERYVAPKKAGKSRSLEELTRREQQILVLMAEGLSNKQISTSLVIEVSTVKNHVHNILVKLGVRNRVQAVNMLKHNNYADGSWLLYSPARAPQFARPLIE